MFAHSKGKALQIHFTLTHAIWLHAPCLPSFPAHEFFYPHGVKNITGNGWDELKKCGNALELTEMRFGMAAAIRCSTVLNSRLPADYMRLQIPVPAGGATSELGPVHKRRTSAGSA
jgi:hypothetical protein